MGMFDWIPCCGPRVREEKDRASVSESTSLLPPPRPGSILSDPGYGGVESQQNVIGVGTSGGLRAEQRARIEEIGREAGNFMLPISRPPGFPKSQTIDSSTSTPPRTHASSRESSRPSSPSPLRPETSPEGGDLKSNTQTQAQAAIQDGEGKGAGEGEGEREGEGEEDIEVVRKQVFLGAGGMGVGRRGGGARGKARGRGPRRGR